MLIKNLMNSYDYKNDSFIITKGKYRGSIVKDTSVLKEILEHAGSVAEAESILNELKQELIKRNELNYKEELKKSDKEEERKNKEEKIIEICTALNPFKNFFILNNITYNSAVVYYKKDDITTPVCPVQDIDAKFFGDTIAKYEKELSLKLCESLKYLIRTDVTSLSYYDVIKIAINVLEPRLNLQISDIIKDPHPAVVAGCKEQSLNIIPYIKEDCTFENLNYILQDYLRRTSYHEHMCAIIWAALNGEKHPYILYLKGRGNDGKSSFVKMLGRLTCSISNFDNSERFNYFNMFGKAILSLNENNNPKIMQSSVLKSVTGGNFVQVEGKRRDAFCGEIRGLVIVDSNRDLELLGTEDEKRRLRYFSISSPEISDDDRLTADEYTDKMGSTPNEFLNYCRACYEKLKLKGGMIQTTPNHNEIFNNMRDVVEVIKFSQFMKQKVYSKGYILDSELKTENIEIIEELIKKFSGDRFAKMNFERYLAVDCGVKIDGKTYYGIGKPANVINITQSLIDDALPKAS